MQDETYISHLLLSHGVKPTANRIVIARTLSAIGRPLTMKELEDRILTIDKSGIFRTLTLFREHHLVHVIDEGTTTGYELCLSHDEDHDDDQHVHFFCEQCHRTFCLPQCPVPAVDLPEGYRQTSASFLVHGLCPECCKKHPHT